MKRISLAVIAFAMALVPALPCVARDGGGFSVAPASLEVSVTESGSSSAFVYITSTFDGDLIVGVEGIPFNFEPKTITVGSSDSNRKVELMVHGNPEIEPGQYSGKLTFLTYTGKNIAYGIKVDFMVTQTGGRGVVAGLNDRLNAGDAGGGGVNYTVLSLAGLAVIAALFAGMFIGRRWRRPPRSPAGDDADGIEEDE